MKNDKMIAAMNPVTTTAVTKRPLHRPREHYIHSTMKVDRRIIVIEK